MSYEILYDRKFIRTSRGIVPMVLSGSSNCTETAWNSRGKAYERLERHWWAWVPRTLSTKDHPEADYLNAIANICGERGSDYELARWNGQWLTCRQWHRWFRNGCNSAMSIEEYLSSNHSQSFNAYISIYTGADRFTHTQEMEVFIRTTEELESWLDKANDREKEIRSELNGACNIYLCLSFSSNEPLKMSPREVKGEVVAKRRNSFLKDYEKDRCLIFTSNPLEAKVFPSIEIAKQELGSGWTSVRFVKAAKQLHPMNYSLRVLHGRLSGRYILRKTKGHLFPAFSIDDAKRFPSRSAAINFAKETAKRGFRIGETISVVNVLDNTEEEICIREEAS